MSNERKETIADIVSEMRIGDLCASDTAARSMYINDFLDSYADRIEAAHKREIADEKRISDAVIQSLRDRKLEMEREIVAKDAEVSALRALVKEMADELSKFHAWEETRALVAKAREVIGGAE